MGLLQSPNQFSDASARTAMNMKPNVSVDWLHGGKIVVFTVNAMTTRTVVDEWFDLVAGVVRSWPPDKPYLAMQNVSDKRVNLTPYARSRVREFDNLLTHLQGRIAIVLPNTFTGHLIRLFLTTMRWQKKLPTEGFLSYQDGLNWLEKGLPTSEAAQPSATATKS
jgi:hypothetical protein